MSMQPVEALNASTYERVKSRIVDDIVSGVWHAGEQVTLAQLTARYAVSQTPVREAVRNLAGEGFLISQTHRGARIPDLSPSFVANIYDVRGAMEAMLVEQAATLATPAALLEIEARAADFEHAAAEGDMAAILTANRLFHRRINEVADNPEALAVMNGRANLVYAVRRRFGYGPARLDAIVGQHRAIVEAIAQHKPKRAAELTLRHCREAKRDLLAVMEQPA